MQFRNESFKFLQLQLLRLSSSSIEMMKSANIFHGSNCWSLIRTRRCLHKVFLDTIKIHTPTQWKDHDFAVFTMLTAELLCCWDENSSCSPLNTMPNCFLRIPFHLPSFSLWTLVAKPNFEPEVRDVNGLLGFPVLLECGIPSHSASTSQSVPGSKTSLFWFPSRLPANITLHLRASWSFGSSRRKTRTARISARR